MKTTNNTTQINHNLKPARLAALAALALIAFAAVIPAAAQDAQVVRPALTLASLKGTWQAALVANGGCGIGAKFVTFTLNNSGGGSATQAASTPGCGQTTGSTGTVAITSLNSVGAGTATLSFGGTNFEFEIQVSKNGQVMTMGEVNSSVNYEVGTAVKE